MAAETTPKLGVKDYLKTLTQEQWNEFMSGKLKVSEQVKENQFWIQLLQKTDQLLKEVNKYSANEIIEVLEQKRPDLSIGNKQKARQRIAKELKATKKVLEEFKF